jgi:signal transduction histidine kinase/FixJ family two-component response regulator
VAAAPDPRERILILAPLGRDAELAERLLSEAGMRPRVCASIAELTEAFAVGAGALLLTQEALTDAAVDELRAVLAQQPAWSDMPLVVLVAGGAGPMHGALAALTDGAANVTLLERPVRVATLVNALRTALRARRWQYRLREQIEALAHAETEERRALHRARHLQELTLQLGRNLDTEALFEKIVDALADLLEASILALYLLEDPQSDFRSVAARGLEPGESGNYLPRHSSLAGRAVDQRRTLTVDDVTLDVNVMLPRLIEGPPVGAVAVAPIIGDGQPIGALEVYSADPRHWHPDEVELLTAFAGAAAVAITNLRHRQQEQQIAQAREDFLAAASHDLKNPLTAIRGSVQMLERLLNRRGSVPNDRLQTSINTISRATIRMTGLIDELLDVARLSMGEQLRLERAPTDLVRLAREQAAMQQATTDRHRIIVDTELPELVGQWDARRLERALENLLSNGIKYSPSGGDVTVSIRRQNGAALISVRDHGIGIPAADLPHVFERFRRAANVLGRIDGTGIGLAAAADMIKEHGGSIDLASQEGEGTVVTVQLPLTIPVDLHGSEQLQGIKNASLQQ